MSNPHQHARSRYLSPRRQHPNPTSYYSDHYPPHPNHPNSYPDSSDRHPPFPPEDQEPQYFHSRYRRRRETPRHKRDPIGYGGTHSSDVPERGTPVGPIDPGLPHSRRGYGMPPPTSHYRTDSYRNHPSDSHPSASKNALQNNNYRGGCPYTYPKKTPERTQPYRHANSQLQRSHLDHEDAREDPSLRNSGTAPISGPVKSKYNSRSPVKPTHNLQPSNNLYNGVTASFRIDSKMRPPETRHIRSLSCEKPTRPQNALSSHISTLRGGSSALGCAAIAHPTRAKTEDAQHLSQTRAEYENGALRSHEGSVEIPETTEQKSMEESDRARDHQTQKRDSVERIFGKNSARVPKLPDENISEWPTPRMHQGDIPVSAQPKEEVKEVKEVVISSNAVKPPILRSVPAPARRSTMDDTPQKRAAAAALYRAGQADGDEVKLVENCQSSRTESSHEDVAPSHAESQHVTDVAEKEDGTARQTYARPVSRPGPAHERKGPPSMKRERKLEAGRPEIQHTGHLKQSTQTSVEHEKQGFKRAKRRGTDPDESSRSTTKRPRPVTSTNAVNVEDQPPLRRSQRFQPPKTNKSWEVTKFEADRVHNLFQAQLRAQPMLLRISFLGMSDGDLRSTLDIFKNGMMLPKPDSRSLEINNNRIRCVTNEICASISALRVSSLNLSCNMLTTLGDKLGQCQKLKFLNLSRNRLSCLPQELCDLTNLEVLNLSANNITRLPSGLGRLKKLEILSLARNELEVLPEDIAGEGAALCFLDISYNHGFRFLPKCTEHWRKLVVLHMADTVIYRSLSRREHRLRPSALLKELAGRSQKMLEARRAASRSHSC